MKVTRIQAGYGREGKAVGMELRFSLLKPALTPTPQYWVPRLSWRSTKGRVGTPSLLL